MWVKGIMVPAYYDNIPFKESVGLMARQKHLKGVFGKADGVVFGHFSGVT
jgi:hypothetical protein